MKDLSRRIVSRLALFSAALVAAVGVLGCGSSGNGTVTGEVKYNGQPLPSGTITFLSQSGHKQMAGSDIVNGKYTIPNIETGPVKVIVVTVTPSKGGQPPNGGKAIESSGTTNANHPYVPIPKRFANPDQSGLTYEVKSGAQKKDFELPR